VAEHDAERVFDDDRLLAFALGLEDDPELAAALAAQPTLRRRLDVLTADFEIIEGELHAMVPPAGPAYERPADATWNRLQKYYAAPKPARPAAGRSWRRLLAPAAALLGVAGGSVGVILSQHGQGGSSSATSSSGEVKPAAQPYGQVAGVLPTKADYALVVVARAGAYRAGAQQFAVVRVLKGKAGATLSVTLAGAAAIKPGDVRLLYLQPTASAATPGSDNRAVTGSGSSALSGSTAPLPSPAATGGQNSAQGLLQKRLSPVSAIFAGRPALIVPLPAGSSADTVTVP
jgi:hypothetical protein